MFLCDLEVPYKVIARPADIFLPRKGRSGSATSQTSSSATDGSPEKDGSVLIYYASSDTRMHVATSAVDRLLDYVLHTPEDGLRSAASVQQRIALIDKNMKVMKKK